jgi:hypothetical protein
LGLLLEEQQRQLQHVLEVYGVRGALALRVCVAGLRH